jgi:hypothetical protein
VSMFDTLKCEMPLPCDVDLSGAEFQTKDIDGGTMDNYTITADGQLILHKVRYDEVKFWDRPYYGKPEWDSPLGKWVGSLKEVPVGDEPVNFNGDLRFYTSLDDKKWYEFVATFKDGKVTEIIADTRDWVTETING